MTRAEKRSRSSPDPMPRSSGLGAKGQCSRAGPTIALWAPMRGVGRHFGVGGGHPGGRGRRRSADARSPAWPARSNASLQMLAFLDRRVPEVGAFSTPIDPRFRDRRFEPWENADQGHGAAALATDRLLGVGIRECSGLSGCHGPQISPAGGPPSV
jgi:hypothetical protein